jgi:hypothetical protein
MPLWSVSFSIANDAAWAPNVQTKDAWRAWANCNYAITGEVGPPVTSMPPMLRRRAGFLGKMALEVAYQCLGKKNDVPIVFSSRHGEASRSVDLLMDLAKGLPLSPTSFGLSVHNSIAGLFSIARADHGNHAALAAGQNGVEHAVIEACGLLADGEPEVLLVVYDCPLPEVFSAFQDCDEQPHAWAWLMRPPAEEYFSLTWSVDSKAFSPGVRRLPGGLDILRFYLRKDLALERVCDRHKWTWTRHV